MKLYKRKNYTGTIRKVCDDEKTVCYGLVGTFGDFQKEGILEYDKDSVGCNEWICIVGAREDSRNGIGATREEAIKNTVFEKKIG